MRRHGEVGEEGAPDGRILDAGDHAQAAVRAGLGEDIETIVRCINAAQVQMWVGIAARTSGVSQLPIPDPAGKPIGIVGEVDVLRGPHHGAVSADSPVSAIAQPIGGLICPKAHIEELSASSRRSAWQW